MKNSTRIFCLLLMMAGYMRASAQVPVFNSHSSSGAVLFLDFDGHTVNGTAWNYAGPIVCGGSGLDDAQIQEVFKRVAEDFAPFDLNVTTDSTRFLSAPADKRMRVIVTISSSWYGVAGGVAFVGSFNWGDDTPCFIFSALHKYRVKDIAEATSHESGHTLGLFHQSKYDATCNKITDYDGGVGTGEIGWAPIMGVGYSKNFTLWHNGANSFGCDSYQNDLEIITSGANGFGYREDDHSNNFDTATIPTFANSEFAVQGVIEKNTDEDMFRFIMPASGQFKLDAIPNNVGSGNLGSDLDMEVSLYSESKTLLSVYNPGTLLSSLVDTFLTPGSYYLQIEGRGNAYASNYASLGSYSLVARIQANMTPLAVSGLHLTGTQNGDTRQFSWTIDADEDVLEQVLEVAVNGRDFSPLTSATRGNRSYVYQEKNPGAAKYRLNVMFSNGRRSYSNLVTINPEEAGSRPKLAGNLIRSSSIYITSPANFSYTIINLNGQVMKKGLLSNGINEVNASGISAGLYVIRFDGNEQQWTEKFVRQ